MNSPNLKNIMNTSTTNTDLCISVFEYIAYELSKWKMDSEEWKKDDDSWDYVTFNQKNDFSKIKLLKLHFFVAAVWTRLNKDLVVKPTAVRK